jgi:hypothetical protein
MLFNSLYTLYIHTKIAFIAVFSITFLIQASPQDFVVVYDITSTFQVNQQTIRREVPGFVSGISYTLSKWTTKPSEAIENDFRNLLGSLGKQQGPPEYFVRDPEGRIVSSILAQWLAGMQPASTIIQCITNYAEYDIFRDIAKTIFNGPIIAKHTNLVPHAATCIEQYAQVIGPDRLYLIGNWDPGSFTMLTRMPHAQRIFAHIPPQNQLISGLTHLLLPRNAETLFTRIATSKQLSLNHIIFVSNMPYHLSEAQRLGTATVNLSTHSSNTMQAIMAILNS